MPSIYHVDQCQVEGSEGREMRHRWEEATFLDGNNYIFTDEHENAVDPFVVADQRDAEDQPLIGDALVQVLAVELFSADRSRAIHLSKSVATALGKHPAWKLWCGNYKTWQELEADHLLVFGAGVDGRTPLSELIDQARAALKQYFTAGA